MVKTKIYENLSEIFPLWRDSILGLKKHEEVEADFVINAIKKYPEKIKSVIDLGGGVGLHADILANAGFDVTLFDQSKKALSVAKNRNPKIKTILGSFENIKLKNKYDAAICMWSSLSYILSEKGRKNFYRWQNNNIKYLIILDQANYYKYPKKFHKTYYGQDSKRKINITRDWLLTMDGLKKTRFIYKLFNKTTGEIKIINDGERQQYLSLEKLQKYFSPKWKLKYFSGNFNLKKAYDKKRSARIITVFFKQ